MSAKKRILKNKKLYTTSLILLLAASMTLATALQTNAQTYAKSLATYAYLVVTPNPTGINQATNIVFWLDSSPPQRPGQPYYGWQGITVEVTRPDGTKETKGPFETDSVGGKYFLYTPTITGKYSFKVIFPGQEVSLTSPVMSFPAGLIYFQPCVSRTVELTVQQQQIQSWPEVPLPTGYWTRPISAENRDWYQIAGNWLEAMGLGATGFNAFTTAPETAHIVWTKPMTFGGIADGELGWGKAYYNGVVYEARFRPPVIMNGYLYYNMFPGSFGAAALPGVICIDLRTGQEIWKKEDMPQISRGQVVNFEGENQYGAIAYLWATSGSTWQMFDAFTGRLISNYTNAGSGTTVYGPKGELLVYTLNAANNWLSLWNSTLVFVKDLTGWSAGAWRPTATVNWSRGIQWNVTIPDVPGSQSIGFIDYDAGVIVAESTIDAPTFIDVGYDTKTGTQLWTQNRTGYGYGFSGAGMPGLISSMAKTINQGVYVFYQKETQQWHAFNALTGNKMWSTVSVNSLTGTDYSMYDWAAKIAYGKLYVTGYSGCVIAFNLQTGDHLWTYSQGSSGLQTPYGSWPVLDGLTVGDNKIYVPCVEHTPYTPMMRGYTLFCIDAQTGEFLWKIPGFPQSVAIADGYLVHENGYDNLIYCFGKGQTLTTVSAPQNSIVKGHTVTITGSITDQSPGALGSPVISDVDMTAWMKYLYMQEPKPTNATGVQVTITAVDSQGNIQTIGQTTTDLNGNYGIMWTPTLEGLHKIIATFEGTCSYFASDATTYAAVEASSAAPLSNIISPTSTPALNEPLNPTTPTIAPIIIDSPSPAPNTGINTSTELYIALVAVIIIAAITTLALFLRKPK